MTSYYEQLAAFMRDVEKAARQAEHSFPRDLVEKAARQARQAEWAVPRDLVEVAAWMDRIELDVQRLGLAPPAPATPRPVEAPQTSLEPEPAPATPADELRALQARLAVVEPMLAAFQAGPRKGSDSTKRKYQHAREARAKRLQRARDERRRAGLPSAKKDAARALLSKKNEKVWNRLTRDQQKLAVENFLRSCRTKKS